MKRILITGSNGLLGQKVVELLSRSSCYSLLLISKEDQSVFDAGAFTYRMLDVSRRADVRKVVDEFEPEVIVHTAAMTNVDQCETERGPAWKTNVTGVENLVHASKLVGATLIHISTDYVFDGKAGPYSETDRPNPISYYGRTKLASENILQTSGVAFALLRTMILYGTGRAIKPNFALWLVNEMSQSRPVRVVDDQIGNPTLADDLAYAILKVIELGRTGLYHVAGPDLVSRYDFAVALAGIFKFNKKLITPVKTATLKQPAPRPMKSGFITLKAQFDLGVKMSGVQQGVAALKNQLAMNFNQRFGEG